MKIYIVIAAYNEGNRITKVIQDLRNHNYKNIVVTDDGSTDDTFEHIKNAIALRHPINRGQGAALKTGIDYALKQDADIIVTFDADGQHLASEIPKLIEPIKKGYDIVIGSRFLGVKSKIPLMRKILLKGSILIIRLFYRIKVTDAHNGFRALNKKAAKKIEIKMDRMGHASEIIDEIKKKKLKFKEVPVKIKYTEETLEKGHGGIKQAIKVLWEMLFHKIKK